VTGKVVLITVTTCIIFIREAQTTANSASEVPIRNFFLYAYTFPCRMRQTSAETAEVRKLECWGIPNFLTLS